MTLVMWLSQLLAHNPTSASLWSAMLLRFRSLLEPYPDLEQSVVSDPCSDANLVSEAGSMT